MLANQKALHKQGSAFEQIIGPANFVGSKLIRPESAAAACCCPCAERWAATYELADGAQPQTSKQAGAMQQPIFKRAAGCPVEHALCMQSAEGARVLRHPFFLGLFAGKLISFW